MSDRAKIDEQLAAWTRGLAQMECLGLEAAGILAAPILRNWQLHSDPHLFHRQSFIHIDHPDTSVFPYPGYPWEFSETPPTLQPIGVPSFG